MEASGDNIRLRVAVNGRVIAVAGLPELGVLSCDLSWTRRSPEVATPEVLATPGITQESWLSRAVEFVVGGLDTTRGLSIEWPGGELAVGDELTIRVLPPGEVSPPASQRSMPVAPRMLKRRAADGTAPPGTPDAEPGAAADRGGM